MINRLINYPPPTIENNNDQSRRINNQKRAESFSDILAQKQNPKVSFSKHAQMRINNRDISLNENEKAQLETAIDKVASKGAKESLVLMNDKSFIVNVKNRKVITAMNAKSTKNNVFTNIDSTIVI